MQKKAYAGYIWIESKCLITFSDQATGIKSCRNPFRDFGGGTRWQIVSYYFVDVCSIYEHCTNNIYCNVLSESYTGLILVWCILLRLLSIRKRNTFVRNCICSIIYTTTCFGLYRPFSGIAYTKCQKNCRMQYQRIRHYYILIKAIYLK
jgi:hypothetical protein